MKKKKGVYSRKRARTGIVRHTKKTKTIKKKYIIFTLTVIVTMLLITATLICKNTNYDSHLEVSAKMQSYLAADATTDTEVTVSRLYFNTTKHRLGLYNINNRNFRRWSYWSWFIFKLFG